MRGHVWCKCGHKMVLARTYKGLYTYHCPRRVCDASDPSLCCPYGDQSIFASVVNEFGIYMAVKLAEKAGVLQEFLAGKDEENAPLRNMTANLKALVERKTAERQKWIDAIPSAKGQSVMQAIVEKAEKCSQELQDAQAKLAEATGRLNSVDQRHAAFDHVIKQISIIAPDKIYDTSIEDQRALLDLIGLKVTVSPDEHKMIEQETVTQEGRTVSKVRDHWHRTRAEYNLRRNFNGAIDTKLRAGGWFTGIRDRQSPRRGEAGEENRHTSPFGHTRPKTGLEDREI